MPDRPAHLSCPICPACGGALWRQAWRDADWRLLACRGCGLGRVWPPPAAAGLRAVYDERYFQENYLASRAARLEHFERLWARVEPPAREAAALPLGATGRLLDVGCGPGFFLEVASRRGWEAWGVDPSVAAEHVARPLRDRVVRSRFGEERLTEEAFDVVTFWDSLAHLPEPAEALERAARLLRGGGLLVIKTPARSRALVAAARWIGRYGRTLLHVPQQVYHFTPAALRALCEASRFEVVQLERTSEAPRGTPPAPTVRRALGRRALGALERALNPRPSLLLLARAPRRPRDTFRVADG